jgi:hypothetical protein
LCKYYQKKDHPELILLRFSVEQDHPRYYDFLYSSHLIRERERGGRGEDSWEGILGIKYIIIFLILKLYFYIIINGKK